MHDICWHTHFMHGLLNSTKFRAKVFCLVAFGRVDIVYSILLDHYLNLPQYSISSLFTFIKNELYILTSFTYCLLLWYSNASEFISFILCPCTSCQKANSSCNSVGYISLLHQVQICHASTLVLKMQEAKLLELPSGLKGFKSHLKSQVATLYKKQV